MLLVVNDPKLTLEATRNVLQWIGQSPDLNPGKHVFHLLKVKCPKHKDKLNTAGEKEWQGNTKEK